MIEGSSILNSSPGIPYHQFVATPEHATPTKTELKEALADVDRQLELADGNENTLERFFQRDELLEQQDLLQAEIDASAPTSELP